MRIRRREIGALVAIAPDDPWPRQNEPPAVLAAGRLVAKKDSPTLLRGFSPMRRSRPVRLIILGKDTGSGHAWWRSAMSTASPRAMLQTVEAPPPRAQQRERTKAFSAERTVDGYKRVLEGVLSAGC